MPTYEYECEKCGHRFDVFQRMSAPKLNDCPQDACSGRVKRLIGAGAGIIFKGSGFYETDYKRSASGNEKKTDGKEKSNGSENKPEKKPGESKPVGASGSKSESSSKCPG